VIIKLSYLYLHFTLITISKLKRN